MITTADIAYVTHFKLLHYTNPFIGEDFAPVMNIISCAGVMLFSLMAYDFAKTQLMVKCLLKYDRIKIAVKRINEFGDKMR